MAQAEAIRGEQIDSGTNMEGTEQNPESEPSTGGSNPTSRKIKFKSDLGEDAIFSILVLLPADFLGYIGRRACRSWGNQIQSPIFTRDHQIRHPNSGSDFYVQDCAGRIKLLDTDRGKWRRSVTPEFPFPGEILASSGGVILFHERSDPYSAGKLWVKNPITAQVMELPPIPRASKDFLSGADDQPSPLPSSLGLSSIAYIACTGEYKVVCPVVGVGWNFCCFALTLGTSNMSWRRILLKHSRLNVRGALDFWWKSISAGGVVYWTKSNSVFDDQRCFVVAADLRDETVRVIEEPNVNVGLKQVYAFLGMGDYLGMIVQRRDRFSLYKLVDWEHGIGRTSVVRAYRFILKTGMPALHVPCHFAWLDDLHTLVLWYQLDGVFVAYHVETEKTTIIQDDLEFGAKRLLKHTNSLRSW